jgi:lycopene cyclase domain-containing protein
MTFYGWVLLGSLAGPLLLSFDKKVHFYTHWKSILTCFFFVSIPFILWDNFYASNRIWGFAEKYVGDIYFDRLPLEEILFFVFIPYACLFVHEVLKAYFTNFLTSKTANYYGIFFSWVLLSSSLVLGVNYVHNWYTGVACLLCCFLIICFFIIKKRSWWNKFAVTFTVVAIPFMIVNGILTGAISEDPIVWYNPLHIIGTRIVTVPIEDIYYNLCMLLPMIAIHEGMQRKSNAE